MAAPASGVPGPVTVLGPLTWWPVSGATPPQYPARHGCLVAVVDAVADPRPALFPSLGELVTSWTNFTDIVGANNNLAFRNFNVIDLTADATGAFVGSADFNIGGAPRPANFDVRIRVPECGDIEWQLLVPEALARTFKAADSATALNAPKGFRVVSLRAGSDLKVADVPLRARERHRCIVRVRARRIPREPCVLVLAQSTNGINLGRVTFSIGPRPRRERARNQDADERRSE